MDSSPSWPLWIIAAAVMLSPGFAFVVVSEFSHRALWMRSRAQISRGRNGCETEPPLQFVNQHRSNGAPHRILIYPFDLSFGIIARKWPLAAPIGTPPERRICKNSSTPCASSGSVRKHSQRADSGNALSPTPAAPLSRAGNGDVRHISDLRKKLLRKARQSRPPTTRGRSR